ncbi:hypothetical protein [Maritimibacter sp. UBA3975]|mgnify:CR=1 FL=1|uniref:hypothetical protein n=1 Tax=Maritimibacter sp. UBA3975 TaxID=1946833 RepID=UPI0025C2861E|nr:hypothetical protein [Maritimibacter sp. UBA3975]|tara:strand:+ start:24263 stop:24421 length:159 start_codon:yes stop_codon:yes gene_type:complete
MKAKTFLAAACMTLLPMGAFAMCSGHAETASSCMDGYTWDAETSACVEVVSG